MTPDEAIEYLDEVRNRFWYRGATSTSVYLYNVQLVIEELSKENLKLKYGKN